MSIVFRCSHGHEWSDEGTSHSENGPTSNCPFCGTVGETLTGGTRSATQGDSIYPMPADLPNLPGYQLLRVIGKGGMGVVYHARHEALNRDVALKVILAGEHALAEDLARFLAEAEIVAKLKHPNIVSVYDLGRTNGRPFFTMEFVTGGNLRKRLSGNPMSDRDAATLLLKLARATEHAHAHGVVHRDLKPDNVLLSEAGEPKITDFGVAKRLMSGKELTRTGAILGTPSFMAPEQAAGRKEIGPAADIYALGAILYYCLSGRPPFDGESMYDTLHKVMTEESVSPAWYRPGISRDLETICLKCLQKKPESRYAAAAELADDLERFLARKPILARKAGVVERTMKWGRRRPMVAGTILSVALVFAVLAGAAAWYYDRYLRVHETYYATFAKRHGVYVGVGKLTEEQVRQRTYSYKFCVRAGRVERVDIVDGEGRPTYLPSGMYYLDSLEGTNSVPKRDCTYRLTYDAQGNVTEEAAYDAQGRLTFRLHYTSPTVGAFLGANGFPIPRGGSGVSSLEFVRGQAGDDIELHFRTAEGKPGPDADGAYKWRLECNEIGLPNLITLLDEHDKPLRIKAGYASVRFEWDALGNPNLVEYLDEDGRRAQHKNGYAAIRREHDQFGRLISESSLDENGRLIPSSSGAGAARLRRTYRGPDDFTEEYFDEHDQPIESNIGITKVVSQMLNRDAERTAVQRTYFDRNDRPVLAPNWSAGEIVVTGRDGLELERTFLGIDGKPTLSIDGFARERKRYDENGYMTAWEAFDASGARARDVDWIARKELDYDQHGRCIEERYFGPDERPTLCKRRFARRKMTYNSSGNISSEEYFGLDDQPTRCADGYSRVKFEYDERGHVSAQRFFGPDRNPTWHKKGYVVMLQEHDARGNLVSRKVFAADNGAIVDWTSVHEYRYEYDRWGRVVKELRFDCDGTPRLGPDGAAGISFKRDRYGREIEASFLGFRNELILAGDGYARKRTERDAAGWVTRETYLGLDDQPIAAKNGVARIDYTNDASSNPRDTRYFGADEKPVLRDGRYHRLANQHDDRGLGTGEAYFGLDGTTPTNGPSGYSSARIEYDDRGHRKAHWFFDRHGKPGLHADGNHMNRRYYDDRGLMIEEAYFDKNNQPTNLKESGAVMRYKYDARGNRSLVEVVDADGKLIRGPSGVARFVHEFDDRDNRTSLSYFGPDEKPCLHVEGNASVMWRYNDIDEQTFHEFRDLRGKPVFLKEYGYAQWRAVYDRRGNCTEQQYLDATGQPMNGPKGWSKSSANFNDFNRVTKRRIVDAAGRTLETRVVITKVTPGGYGERLGLKAGDVVLEYDNNPVDDVTSFTSGRDREQPGDPPRVLKVRRAGQVVSFSVTPGRLTIVLQDDIVPAP